MPGTLYLVATPIGNLGDLTFRAVEVLKSVDLVACEDTRRSEKLMRHLGIHKPMLRYDEHTHGPSSEKILGALSGGKSVALLTDAGTPAISDPGARLVRDVITAGHVVTPIPGASSVTSAVSASGFVSDGFVFLGFLPRKPGPAHRVLREALGLGKTVVLFESPFRVEKTLEWIKDERPRAQTTVARELTKLHEEFIRGDVSDVLEQMKSRPQKGEVVIIIGPEPQK
jgi:16S rRNA (cytidine1402-2'-O)-methyltransferase